MSVQSLSDELVRKLEVISNLPPKQQEKALRDLNATAEKCIEWHKWIKGAAA